MRDPGQAAVPQVLRHRPRVVALLAVLALLAALVQTAVTAPPAQAADPDQVGFTLEGCRNDGTIVLPNGSNEYICPDAAYTTGNLQKGWNELDLVPLRVTADAKAQAPASQNYTVMLAVDARDGGRTGYDVIGGQKVTSTPPMAGNCALTQFPDPNDESTWVDLGQEPREPGFAYPDDPAIPNLPVFTITSGGGGGVAFGRQYTVAQSSDTSCQFDFYARLSLGSSEYPGASLQFYLFNQLGTSSGIGQRTVSIPVNQLQPQQLSKTMTATQGGGYAWNVTKSVTPVTVDLGDTCRADAALSQEVAVDVEWQRVGPTAAGSVVIGTNITLTNPASREIRADVTDVMRNAATPIPGGTRTFEDVRIPARSSVTVTHAFEWDPAGATEIALNDIATATYTDPVNPNDPIPGENEATASATVQPSGANDNAVATLVDVESVSGAGWSYSVDAASGASGSFGGYTLGTPTTEDVTWTSDQLSGSGSVRFDKTLYLDRPRITQPAGALTDTATITASEGFTTSASASAALTSTALVDLTIDKTIPDILQGDEQVVFLFDTTGGLDGNFSDQRAISFGAGETTGSATVPDLLLGQYTVAEVPQSPWVATPASQQITINPTNGCSASLSFANDVPPATAVALKTTTPPGQEQGWTVTLAGPGTGPDGVVASTDADGRATFEGAGGEFPLQEGQYTITEVVQDGWRQVSSENCTFTVDYPADAGEAFTCQLSNEQLGGLDVTKTVAWSGVAPDPDQTFEICIAGPSYPNGDEAGACQTTVGFAADGSQTLSWADVIPGAYVVSESDPGAQWAVTGSGVTTAVPAGGTGSTTITNTRLAGGLVVSKTVNWNGVTPDPAQTFEVCVTGPAGVTVDPQCQLLSADNGFTVSWPALDPGDYGVTESPPGNEWTVSPDTGQVQVTVAEGETARADFTNARKLGSLVVTKAADWNGITPSGEQTFRICITGPSFPSPSVDNGGCQDVTFSGDGESDLSWGSLIPGDYTVSEVNPGSSWEVDVPDVPVTVDETGGQAGPVSVSNTRRLGALSIEKIVNWQGIPAGPGQEFEICIAGPSYPTGTEVGACLPTRTFTGDGSETLQWTDLQPGSYVVAEVDPGAQWTVSGSPQVQIVPNNGATVSGTVVNTRKLASVAVIKDVIWNGVTPDSASTFEVCLTGPSHATPDCRTVDFDGGLVGWGGLIPGQYVVTENDPGSAWLVTPEAALSQGITVLAPDSGGTGTATITNQRRLGSIEITKTVDWNGVTPEAGTLFTVCIQGPSYPETPACQPIVDGATVSFGSLVPGTYSVTETGVRDEWDVLVTPDGGQVVVDIDGSTVSVDVTNTRKLGSLVVTKDVVWGSVTPDPGQEFEVCVEGPSYPDTPDCQTVGSAGGDLSWSDLVPGEYVVSETDAGPLWATSIDNAAPVVPGGRVAGGSGDGDEHPALGWSDGDQDGGLERDHPRPGSGFRGVCDRCRCG